MPDYHVTMRDDGVTYYSNDLGNYLLLCDICHTFHPSHGTSRFYTHNQMIISVCDACQDKIVQWGWIVRCEHCNSIILRDSNTTSLPNGNYVCPSCECDYAVCSHCGEYRYIRYSGCGMSFCSSICMHEEGYTICQRCNDMTPSDDYDVGRDACNTCIEYHSSTCNACGNEFYDYDGYNSEFCSEDCYEHNNQIRSYSYKPMPVFYSAPLEDTKRFFGVELEIDRGDKTAFLDTIDTNDNRFYLKEDGSLGEYGIEIVTHPMSLKYHQSEFYWNEITEVSKRAGYRSHNTDTCGLHIHVSKNSVSLKRWCKFTLFWYSHDSLIEKMCRRSNTHYCEKKFIRDSDSVDTITRSSTRYEAVNFQNRNTVEIRQFKGTLNPTSILASIEFIDFLLNWLYRIPLKKIVSLTSSDFQEALTKQSKKYPNLVSYSSQRLED